MHHRILANLAETDGSLPDIAPGVLMDGDDLGKWLQQPGIRASGRGSCPNSRHG
ncbi:hypothetical protein ACFWDI_39465 [Streptomyces sp. NPDC060064]|uniref:hypothetical protein n=1 Tax=Streptomyces sp. NPDC060064 TaxID=3347049 RepID=UPI00367E3B97